MPRCFPVTAYLILLYSFVSYTAGLYVTMELFLHQVTPLCPLVSRILLVWSGLRTGQIPLTIDRLQYCAAFQITAGGG